MYDVVFSCPWAEYFYTVKECLPLEEAEELANKMNTDPDEKPHGWNGCCQYYVQKPND